MANDKDKKKFKKLLDKAQRLKAIKISNALRKEYEAKLKAFINDVNKSVKYWTLARLNKAKDKNLPKQLVFELNALLKDWDIKAKEIGKTIARSFANRNAKYVDLNIANDLKDSDILKSIGGASGLAQLQSHNTRLALVASYERNLGLITSIPKDIIDRYKQGFLNASLNFDREAFLKIALQYDKISLRKASLIARDQTQKAVSEMQHARAQDLGFNYYVWQTSQDERVSSGEGGHRALHNRIYRYDNPTAIIDSYKTNGHPAQRVNCRCIAISIIPNATQKLKLVKDSVAGDYYELIQK